MSASTSSPGGQSPRFVTKAPSTSPSSASPYAVDPTRPNPVVSADAMGSTVLAHLITGPVLFGGLGWLLDRWLGITVFVAVGIILGMGLSLYAIWLRYGTSQAPTTDHPAEGSTRAAAPHNEEIQ